MQTQVSFRFFVLNVHSNLFSVLSLCPFTCLTSLFALFHCFYPISFLHNTFLFNIFRDLVLWMSINMHRYGNGKNMIVLGGSQILHLVFRTSLGNVSEP